jgi:hypothetical protein
MAAIKAERSFTGTNPRDGVDGPVNARFPSISEGKRNESKRKEKSFFWKLKTGNL